MKKQFYVVLIILTTLLGQAEAISYDKGISEVDSRTFMLSNEAPGYLIDNLIAAGYGDSSLYAVMQYLQPLSGGTIPQWFMDSLAVCPANSDVFTAKVFNLSSPYNNPVGIGEDGNTIVAQIYGRNYYMKEGYLTYNDTLVPVSLKLFTKATEPEYYIDAGTNVVGLVTTYYKAFAIAWSMGSTFVLSNEGGLIDDLIRAGNGDKNLYQTLQILKPKSEGVISNDFMATLANCPAGSEIFTAALSNFSVNYPVCINSDGTISIQPIYGKDYFRKDGYITLPLNQGGYTSELFTVANSAENYINAGQTGDGIPTIYYKAFAVAWKASTTFVLTNEGGLIDDLIRAGNGDKNLYQTLEILKPKSGGIISDEFMATLANCPAGSEIFTAALNNFSVNYPVCINTDGTLRINPIFGKDYFLKDGYTNLPLNQGGYTSELFTHANSAENYIDAGSTGTSGGTAAIYYKAFAIAWKASTTFVLTNEGGLIDDLIRAGNGDKNLYQTLEILKPKSGGVISDEFMATLANCPAGSDIFTAALNNFAGLNNPVCINTDGTLKINPIFGKDYLLKDGYTTLPLNQNGYTSELFTVANSSGNYIDAGSGGTSGGTTTNYKAFAIAWKASTTFVLTNEGGLIDDLIRAGNGAKNLYQTLEILKPKSGGVISDEFIATLANCPAGSDIFTAPLSVFGGLNNPICVNTDGTLSIQPIFARTYQKEGYTALPLNQGGYTSELFTVANSAENYINAGQTGDGIPTIYYKAFAIAWKASTTFVLTNEGGLIDDLIRAGHGDKNLYQTLEVLKIKSAGVISDEFMATLANCPAKSEIFNASLSNFAGLNNPVCVNSDGTLGIQPIFGKDYFLNDGYSTIPLKPNGYTSELFTHANSAEYYIDAGSGTSGRTVTNYKAFAIAWKASTTFVLTNEGGLIDDLIRAGNGDKNLYQTLQILKLKSGGVISDEFMETLANCPAGSDIFTAALSNFSNAANNPIAINTDGTMHVVSIYGKYYFQNNEFKTLPENQNGYTSELFTYATNQKNYIDVGSGSSNPPRYYKAFAIAWKASTTFVLTNEGGLIDDLIRAGNGDKNLYQILEILKPKSGGVISDEFMATLANCPAEREIFTAELKYFAGMNNPVCVNTDGTLGIQPIFGKDIFLNNGYSTIPLKPNGYTSELFTVANSVEYFFNAGAGVSGGSITNYKAFAITWKASTTFVLTNEGGLIDELIATGYAGGNLYQTLVSLAPASNGVISEAFLECLAMCPANSEIYTATLSNFAGLNNPVCVNTDGTLGIRTIFGKDYYGNIGYATYPEIETEVERELFTYATSPVYYIDAGASGQSPDVYCYKAFAIGWSNKTINGIANIENNQCIFYPTVVNNELKFYLSANETDLTIKIFDSSGKFVEQIYNPANNVIDFSGKLKGLYLIQLQTKTNFYTEKIVKL